MATHLYNPSKPKAKKPTKPAKPTKSAKSAKPTKPAKRSVGGFELTPLISALLLAGVKLSLEQNRKKNTSECKSSKPKRRPRTV